MLKPFLLVFSVIVIGMAFYKYAGGTRNQIMYDEHLDDVVATIDGEEIKFRDLAVYILYEERVVEEQARIYNPSSPKDYWNMHTDDKFIATEAKDAIIGMAIHDKLYYQLACELEMDNLSEEEKELLEYTKIDFFEDLLDEQWQKMPCPMEEISEQMKLVAIAEKYQDYLAKANDDTVAAYRYDGYCYNQLKETHDIKINEKLWTNFIVGDITLSHGSVNYINGLTDEDKKKSKK